MTPAPPPPLLADDEASWPGELVQLLTDRKDVLAAYLVRERAIDRAAEKDVALRWDRPDNEHEAVWEETLRTAQALVAPRDLVGYHCTRLTEDEQGAIMSGGLSPLSPELIADRVRRQTAVGLIPQSLAEQLVADNQSATHGRTDLLWFIFSRRTLADKSGVERFFRTWGGEAVYWNRESNGEGATLRLLGTPCIVVAAVPASGIRTFHDVGRRFVMHFLARRRVRVPDDPAWEGRVLQAIEGERVLRIIRLDEPEFQQLTKSRRWTPAL